jgi:hypothetical protein
MATNGGDIEAARESADTKTYQSTVLPGGGQDFVPEAHHRMFRKFANPAPLGLCGFALTTFVLSLVNVHARSVTTPNIVIGLGILYLTFPVLIVSPCLRWSCPILRGNVGICFGQYLWRLGLQLLWCLLDQFCSHLHSLLRCPERLHDCRRVECCARTLSRLYLTLS